MQPYYQSFLHEANSHHVRMEVSDLYMHFTDGFDGTTTLGRCTHGDLAIVEISRNAWNRFSDESREQLIFHELGHCLLGRHHTSDIWNNIPKSIMNPIQFSDWVYVPNRVYYLNELFTQI